MKKILITLNDQGGECMTWNYEELADTLRAQTHGHLPIIVYEIKTANRAGREFVMIYETDRNDCRPSYSED